jgi:succinate dehydrogenase / fumarate reductase, cytochrome b subunit
MARAPASSRVVRLLRSSIGQKMLMGATGLLLLAFLVAHLIGNVLVFVGPATFNEYSHKLISNPLVYVAEIGLVVLFAAHFVSGFLVTRDNARARPVGYAMKRRAGGASHKSVASTTMFLSGLLILAFVPLHLWTFKYGPHYATSDDPAVRDLYRLVIEIFSRPLEVIWYVLAMVVIGFHLWHAFGSGLESLGVSYRRSLRWFGQGLAVVLTAGFVIIPIAVYLWIGRP